MSAAPGKGWPARIFLGAMALLAISLGARLVYELLAPLMGSLIGLAALVAIYWWIQRSW